ncbi:MAG: hypothetical protein R2795_09085 [Saprospiraceae bacterium]
MRILGYIDHPVMKITVFRTDTRVSIKFEHRDFEQTYKFRPDIHTNSLVEIRQLVDETFAQAVMKRFQQMERDLGGTFGRNLPSTPDELFPNIV